MKGLFIYSCSSVLWSFAPPPAALLLLLFLVPFFLRRFAPTDEGQRRDQIGPCSIISFASATANGILIALKWPR